MLKEKLSGDLDIVHAEEFKNKYMDILNNSPDSIEFDCTDLQFVDSTGLGALASLSQKAADCGEKIILIHLKLVIAKLFEITNLSSVITIKNGD